MTATMNRNSMMSYSASANNAEATFACENMFASAIIMGAAVAALFFVIISIIVGVRLSVLIVINLLAIIILLVAGREKSPEKLKQQK